MESVVSVASNPANDHRESDFHKKTSCFAPTIGVGHPSAAVLVKELLLIVPLSFGELLVIHIIIKER